MDAKGCGALLAGVRSRVRSVWLCHMFFGLQCYLYCLGLIRGVGGHGGGGLACTSVCVTSKRTRRLIASKC